MNRDKRWDGDKETGKCFRVVPLARSHCYLTRTRRADARRTTSEKGRERESIVEVPPNAIPSHRSVHAYQLDVQSLLAVGVLIIDMLCELHSGGERGARYVADKDSFHSSDTRRSIEFFLKMAGYTKWQKGRKKKRRLLRINVFFSSLIERRKM